MNPVKWAAIVAVMLATIVAVATLIVLGLAIAVKCE